MGNSQRHIVQWKHNRSFAATIQPQYPDWIVTALFYVVLHAVDTLLAYDKVQRVTSHDARNTVLIDTSRYQQIKKHYLPLYSLSQVVRYLADPVQWLPSEQIGQEVVKRYVYPIEKSVQKLIGQNLDLGPVVLLTK